MALRKMKVGLGVHEHCSLKMRGISSFSREVLHKRLFPANIWDRKSKNLQLG